MSTAAISAQQESEYTLIKVKGSLNEFFDWSNLKWLHEISEFQKKILIDVSQVDYINSIGIQNWLGGSSENRKFKNHDVELISVPQEFWTHMGMIPALSRGVTIRSFFTPFKCSKCNISTEVLLQSSNFQKSSKYRMSISKNVPCESCGVAMAVDAWDEEHFWSELYKMAAK